MKFKEGQFYFSEGSSKRIGSVLVERKVEAVAVMYMSASQKDRPLFYFIRALSKKIEAVGALVFFEDEHVARYRVEFGEFLSNYPEFDQKSSSGYVADGGGYISFPLGEEKCGQLVFVFENSKESFKSKMKNNSWFEDIASIMIVACPLVSKLAAVSNPPLRSSIAALSHELKTPLNGIVQMSFLLADSFGRSHEPIDIKRKEWVDVLMNCSNQLLNQLNNFLLFDSIKNGKLRLTRQEVNIKKIVNDSCQMVDNMAKQKNIKIHKEVGQFPLFVGDPVRITQILNNILSNAIKFTPGDTDTSIFLKVKTDSGTDQLGPRRIHFSIKDQGIGISKSAQKEIFEAFEQGDAPSSYRSQGVGLGLSICKSLTRMMGGDISVRSKGENKGSTFSFHISLDQQINLEQLHTSHRTLFNEAKILVVDDRKDVRIYLSEILLKWTCVPTVVASAEEAMAFLERPLHFDVAICDILMSPGMSGIELACKIKNMPNRKNMPLIALSSDDTKAGMDLFEHYLIKPVDETTIFPCLLDCLKKSVGSRKLRTSILGGTLRSRKKKFKELRVLVVEDDVSNSYTLGETLISFGIPEDMILYAKTGTKALEIFSNENLDCVFMDNLLPDINGVEICRRIKKVKPECYVIFVTATSSEEDRLKIQEAGADSFVEKPVLREKIKSALVMFS